MGRGRLSGRAQESQGPSTQKRETPMELAPTPTPPALRWGGGCPWGPFVNKTLGLHLLRGGQDPGRGARGAAISSLTCGPLALSPPCVCATKTGETLANKEQG